MTETVKRKRLTAAEAWGDRSPIVFDNLTTDELARVMSSARREAEREDLAARVAAAEAKLADLRAQLDKVPADERDAIAKAVADRIRSAL